MILDAARSTFAEYGYEGASMRIIATKAAISVGGLYLYFKNKEELCLTMMKEHFDSFARETKAAMDGFENPVDAIRAYIRISVEYATRNKELILTNNKERCFAFGMELKREFFKDQRLFLEDLITKGIESGDFAPRNVQEAAKIIVSALRGFVFSIVIDPDNLFSDEEFTNLLMNGLLRTKAPSV